MYSFSAIIFSRSLCRELRFKLGIETALLFLPDVPNRGPTLFGELGLYVGPLVKIFVIFYKSILFSFSICVQRSKQLNQVKLTLNSMFLVFLVRRMEYAFWQIVIDCFGHVSQFFSVQSFA